MKSLTLLIILATQLASAETSPLFIKTESGYELNGFRDYGFSNQAEYRRNYRTKAQDIEFYESILNKKKALQILKDGSHTHVYLTANNGTELTSVLLNNGKFVSQVNCQKQDSKMDSCFLVTKDICKAMLDRTGKKNFTEFYNQVRSCEDIFNHYRDTLKSSKHSNLTYKTYNEHKDYLDKQGAATASLWSKLFTDKTTLESGNTKTFSADMQLYSLINICKSYAEGKVIDLELAYGTSHSAPSAGTK